MCFEKHRSVGGKSYHLIMKGRYSEKIIKCFRSIDKWYVFYVIEKAKASG